MTLREFVTATLKELSRTAPWPARINAFAMVLAFAFVASYLVPDRIVAVIYSLRGTCYSPHPPWLFSIALLLMLLFFSLCIRLVWLIWSGNRL